MSVIRVLVDSPGTAIGTYLLKELPHPPFDVVVCEPGVAFQRAVEELRPEIAVLGRVAERPRAVLHELHILRETRPEVVILTVNTAPCTPETAAIGRLGFRHLCECTGQPIGPELVRLIRITTDALLSGKPNPPEENVWPVQHLPTIRRSRALQRPMEALR